MPALSNILLVALVCATVILILGWSFWRTEAIAHEVKGLIVAAIIGLFVFAFCIQQYRVPPSDAFVMALVAAGVAYLAYPRRKRRLRATERRKAIARFELETGKKYNPRKHDIDHVVPFARGGNSSADNLKVMTRRENRRKGSKSPWWDIWG